MKKFVMLLLLVLFCQSCDEPTDEIVEVNFGRFEVASITAPDSFVYSSANSEIVTTIMFRDIKNIAEVWLDVKSSDGEDAIVSHVNMLDNGDLQNYSDTVANDLIYTTKFSMSDENYIGDYEIEYFALDVSDIQKKIGTINFKFDNGRINYPPVISDLQLPDSVSLEQNFSLSISVQDENGNNDIKNVYYELFDPDSIKRANSQGITKFPLFDDGNTSMNGDQTANDGIYTTLLEFPADEKTGVWLFEFRAIDRQDSLSNKISKELKVK